VTDPTVFGAWKFEAFTDIAHLPDAELAPLVQAADIPATPSLITPDDGSAGIFIVDGSVIRHVQNPASMTAWRFSATELAKVPAAQFNAMTQGLPWPETPFLAQGSGAAVYMIDITTPPPPPDGGTPSTMGDASSSRGGETSSGGCSMSPPGLPSHGQLILLYVVIGFMMRPRTKVRAM
jgi:hypothetical protein